MEAGVNIYLPDSSKRMWVLGDIYSPDFSKRKAYNFFAGWCWKIITRQKESLRPNLHEIIKIYFLEECRKKFLKAY